MHIVVLILGGILTAFGFIGFFNAGTQAAAMEQGAYLACLMTTIVLIGVLLLCTGLILISIRKLSSSFLSQFNDLSDTLSPKAKTGKMIDL